MGIILTNPYLLIPGLIIAIAIMRFPFFGGLLLYTMMFLDTRSFPAFKDIEKIILLFSLGMAIFHASVRGRGFVSVAKLFVIISIFFFITFISMWINDLTFVNFFAYSYGEGKILILVCIYFLYPLNERETKFCLIYMMMPLIFQIPFLLDQAVESGGALPQGNYADYYTGTVGELNNTRLACAGITMGAICWGIIHKNYFNDKSLLATILAYCWLLPILTDSKTLVILLIASLGLYFAMERIWPAFSVRRLLKGILAAKLFAAIATGTIICAGILYLLPETREVYGKWTWYEFKSTSNIRVYENVFDHVLDRFEVFIFGLGPGTSMSTVAATLNSPFYYDFVANTWDPRKINLSISGSGTSTVGAFLGDLGLLGAVFFSFCVYWLFKYIALFAKSIQTPFSRVILAISQLIFIYLVIYGCIGPSFENWLNFVPLAVCLGYTNTYLYNLKVARDHQIDNLYTSASTAQP